MIKIFAILLLTIIVFSPGLIFADAEKQNLEKRVNGFLTHISYDEVQAGMGKPVPFTFDLFSEDETEQIDFDSVLVNITPALDPSTELLTAEIQKASSGITTITYDFPESGEYVFEVDYKREGQSLANLSFGFSISKDFTENTGFVIDNKESASNKTLDGLGKYLWIIALVVGIPSGWALKTLLIKQS